MRGNSGRADLRELRPWPSGIRFSDARSERVIEQAMPPRPVVRAYGSSGAMCVQARFAESEIDGRLG